MASSTGSNALGVGDILSRTFSVWGKNAVAYGILGIIFGSPAILATLLDPNYENTVLTSIARTGAMLAGFVVSGAVTFGVFQQLRGQPVPLAQCIQVGLSRFLPILLAGLLLVVLLMVGFLLLVIPGIIMTAGFFVAVPVATVENPGPVAAIKRSWALTDGYKLNIFLANLVMGLLLGILGAIVGAILGVLGGGLILQVVIQVVSLFFGALAGVMGAVVYHDLRVKKDGLGTDDLVKVFQ